MMKKRLIISNDKSLKQTYQYFKEASLWAFFAFIVALNISDLVPFFRFSNKTKNYLTGLSFFVLLVCL